MEPEISKLPYMNWKKLKEAIHSCVAQQRKEDGAIADDMALYATYLYCVASHARGVLHMKVWNTHYPYPYDTDRIYSPRVGRYTFDNLENQKKFIEATRKFILARQMHLNKYKVNSPFANVPVDFELSDIDAIKQSIANITERRARLVLTKPPSMLQQMDEQLVKLNVMLDDKMNLSPDSSVLERPIFNGEAAGLIPALGSSLRTNSPIDQRRGPLGAVKWWFKSIFVHFFKDK